jgi:hypothetical protein
MIRKQLHSAYQRYLDRFRKPTTSDVPKAHLGETLITDIGETVRQRLNQILPFFVDKPTGKNDNVNIRTSQTSFWDGPRKYLILTVFIEFEEDTKWKDQ